MNIWKMFPILLNMKLVLPQAQYRERDGKNQKAAIDYEWYRRRGRIWECWEWSGICWWGIPGRRREVSEQPESGEVWEKDFQQVKTTVNPEAEEAQGDYHDGVEGERRRILGTWRWVDWRGFRREWWCLWELDWWWWWWFRPLGFHRRERTQLFYSVGGKMKRSSVVTWC